MDNGFNLTGYIGDSIKRLTLNALNASLLNPKETAFIIKYILKSKRAQKIRNNYEKKGKHIPAFLIASITESCNLSCKGCYAIENNKCRTGFSMKEQLSCDQWNHIFNQAEELGVAFILLAGGEPLLRKDIIQYAAKHKCIIFPVFTNGTMINDEYINLFDDNRNLVPVLSIEGSKEQTDNRRGDGVFEILKDKMEKLKSHGIFYGVSITVTTQNILTVTDKAFIKMLYNLGCKVVFYVEYVPAALNSRYLAPSDRERQMLDERQTILRTIYKNMIFISFPGDEKHTGGCLAAGRGFFHINAAGGAEPCPFSPFSDISLKEHTLLEAVNSKLFQKLNLSGMLLGEHKGGCLLFEKEHEVKRMLAE